VKLTAKDGNKLTVIRGFQGAAKAWEAGTTISRNFTAYDHDAFAANINTLHEGLIGAESQIGETNTELNALKEDVSGITEQTGELREYVDEQDEAVLLAAQTYADGKADTAQEAAIGESKAYTDSAVGELKEYTDTSLAEGLAEKLSLSGGAMLGKLYAAPSGIENAGFSFGAGIAPVTPENGDMWATPTGLFAQINGETRDLFAKPSNAGTPAIPIPSVKYRRTKTTQERIAHIVLGRAEMTAIALDNGIVLLVGGVDDKNRIDGNMMKISVRSGWRESLASMPTPRIKTGVAFDGELVYVIGGRDRHGRIVSTVEAYSVLLNTWVTLPDISVPREGCRVIDCGEKLYCIGGRIGKAKAVDTVEVYDKSTRTWSALAPMTTPRFAFGTRLFNEAAVCMGGEMREGIVGTNESLSTKTNTWMALCDMPEGQTAFDIEMHNGVMCGIGGRSLSGASHHLFCYIPAANTWQDGDEADVYDGAAGLSLEGGIYSFGGRSLTETPDAAAMKYRPGRIKVLPVASGDTVWSMTEIFTDTQRIEPESEVEIRSGDMLYTDADFEYGWIRKGGD